MSKSQIHPKWFNNTVVYCDGKPLCVLGSTKPELQVDLVTKTSLKLNVY